jgi:hypothetical protein
LLLNILNDWVTEPAEVNTVSKNKVSALVYKLASALVMKDSFLQERKIIAEKKMKSAGFKIMLDD